MTLRRKGMHPADIRAAIEKKEKTLSALALENDLKEGACRVAISRPHRKGEKAIAAFLNIPAQQIWPDRYLPCGTRRHPQPQKNYNPPRRFGARQNGAAA